MLDVVGSDDSGELLREVVLLLCSQPSPARDGLKKSAWELKVEHACAKANSEGNV